MLSEVPVVSFWIYGPVPAIADHVAVPVLRLQEACEPAPALAQKRGHTGRRVRAGPAGAQHFGVPGLPRHCGVAQQAVDQLVILHQAIRVETAHLNHGRPPEAGERAANQQQPVSAHPGVTRQEIADIFIGLEPLQHAAVGRVAAHRR